ncbi:tetratricopeptide repeat protein [uncultured Tateyamaria sp.]|uniref:tetratricopeptide repeat protein n=1 Tax=Tateyamaria sp. 1078 TaxID=3417464 RepID=UPI0026116E67|nr:tetratricopeptide repeat protein [uncultured Tateyamaria sp.]
MFEAWGSGEWSLLVAVLALIGVDGARGWRALNWMLRGFRPEPEKVAKVQVVATEASAAQPAYPKIVPPPKERTLVAREPELERIRSILESRHGVQITGQQGVALKAEGGRGKTALAREYADRFRDLYDGGKWLAAQSRLSLLDDLAALGNAAFDLKLSKPLTDADGKTVLDRLAASGGKWLLVYDNLDDFEEVKGLICSAPNVDVIITTRLSLGLDAFGRIDVEVLDFETSDGGAVQLLLQEGQVRDVSPEDRTVARDVAKALGGLPLALVLGGALLREEKWSLTQLRDEVDAVLTLRPEAGDYPDSVAGAVMLTYGRLEPDSQLLADMCAWLAPDEITLEMFVAGQRSTSLRPKTENSVASRANELLLDTERLRKAFRGLRRWSVLTGSGPYDIHRLTQAVLRQRQINQGRDFETASAVADFLSAQAPSDPNRSETWSAFRKILPHIRALWKNASPLWYGSWDKPGWPNMDFAANQAGILLSKERSLAHAIELKRASYDMMKVRLGESHRDLPVAMGNLAVFLARDGALDEAKRLIEEAVSLDEKYRTGATRSDLAFRYLHQHSVYLTCMAADDAHAEGAEAVAEAALEKAGEIRRELFGENSEEIANYWHRLGTLRGRQDRNADMREAYKKAYEIMERVQDPDASDLSLFSRDYGIALIKNGQPDAAVAYLERSYALDTVIYEENLDNPGFHITCDWLILNHLLLGSSGASTGKQRAKALADNHNRDLARLDRISANYAKIEPSDD